MLEELTESLLSLALTLQEMNFHHILEHLAVQSEQKVFTTLQQVKSMLTRDRTVSRKETFHHVGENGRKLAKRL